MSMVCIKWWPILTLLIVLTLFSLSCEASNCHETKEHVHVPGEINGNVFSWRRRSLLQEKSDDAPQGSSMVLAGNRTRRKDPSEDFTYYTGGWDISNEHYLWSVGYSAAGPFIVAAAWSLGFGMFLLISCICYCCCCGRKCGSFFPPIVYTIFLFILILLTVDTIIGSCILFKGQAMFHKNTRKTLNYIIDQADGTSEKLKIVYLQLSTSKKIAMDQKLSLPPEVDDSVDRVLKEIDSYVELLEENKDEIPNQIKFVLDQVIMSLIIICTFMLGFTVLGLVLSFVGAELLMYMFVFIGWILVGGLFLLCGIFLLFHNAVGDTCLAMDQWVQKPAAHTALDDFLSCPDNVTSHRVMYTARNVTVKLLGSVNQFVTLAGNANFPPGPPPTPGTPNYNQTGPPMPLVCLPYKDDLTERPCAQGEVNVANATELYGTFVCESTLDGICTTEGRLTSKTYEQLALATNVSYTLHYYGPFLVELMDCSFVRETFSLVCKDHCPGLTMYSKWIYIGLSMVASGVMVSVLLWLPYAQRVAMSSKRPDPTA